MKRVFNGERKATSHKESETGEPEQNNIIA
jgi:hypothetical protein